MYVKIEPSGCSERRGMVQVRFAMYLDPEDYGYERHHIQVPDSTGATYAGKLDKEGNPIDTTDHQKWIDGLPKVWQTNPFHNHFIQVNPDTTDKEIMDIAEAFLHECYIKWAQDLSLTSAEHQPRNDALPFVKPSTVDNTKITACNTRVQSVKAITVERRI